MSRENYIYLQNATATRPILWHYTSWEGLVSILRSDELWASDFHFMNDTTELLHALESPRVSSRRS
jgi:hypothetical protein